MDNKKIEFIYWFAYYNLDSPSVRYRAKYPLDFFKEEKGIDSYLVVPSYSISGILLFLIAYLSALFFRKRNSLIVIQRVQSNFIYSGLLKLLVRIRRKDTVYDLDDADYLEENQKTIFYFVKNCAKISAGSNAIAAYLSRFNHQIVHTTSPTVDLNIIKTEKNEKLTIGWIGGFGGEHKESLIDLVFPAIKAIAFPVKFTLIGVLKDEDKTFIKQYFQDNLNVEIEVPTGINWRDEAGLQHRIAALDIGVATLSNSEMQLSKSGIKAKQYLNNGVPVLSTNLPENNSVVVDGVNGYFCKSSAEFAARINQFGEMSEKVYLQFSKNARKSIVNFNHERYFADFKKIKFGFELDKSN